MEKGAKNGNFLKFLGKARRPCIYREEMRGFGREGVSQRGQVAAGAKARGVHAWALGGSVRTRQPSSDARSHRVTKLLRTTHRDTRRIRARVSHDVGNEADTASDQSEGASEAAVQSEIATWINTIHAKIK